MTFSSYVHPEFSFFNTDDNIDDFSILLIPDNRTIKQKQPRNFAQFRSCFLFEFPQPVTKITSNIFLLKRCLCTCSEIIF